MKSRDLQENILERKWYATDSETAARELLGKILVRKLGRAILAGTITETEAYLPEGDEAAHNFKGKTDRNKSLYKDAGHIYVHQMRQWHLLDIVVDTLDIPGSVLIRNVKPLLGIEEMKGYRKTHDDALIANGPGKLCQAFLIDRSLDGLDITSADSPLFISTHPANWQRGAVMVTKRIGISKAKDKLLRFYL